MAADDTNWPDGFSTSSRNALRFAWAAAAVRAGHDAPSFDTECDADDVLVGTLLSHPGTSEAEICFRHFGLVAGQVLDPDYPRLTVDALNRRLEAMSSDDLPPFDPDAELVLELARQRGEKFRGGKVHLPHLWRGLLDLQSSLFTTRLMDAFGTRAVELSEVADATERWLADSERSYQDVLSADFPDPRGPTTVVSFKADTTDGASTASGDLLQIGREVDAFAYLLASKDTRPPLAIGLFGDWGSGKTFFMDSVRRRIDGLLADPAVKDVAQGETPFWKKVVSIEFNAWHYAEGELLASLVDHIFTNLRAATYGRADDPVAAEEQGWMKSLDENLRQLTVKQAELAESTVQLSTTEQEIEVLEREREEALETLDEQVATSVLQNSVSAVVGAVGAASERAVDEHMTVGRARDELDAAYTEGTRAWASIRWIGRSGWRILLAVVAVALVPVIVEFVDRTVDSSALATAAGVAAVAAQVLGWSAAFARKYLDGLEAARRSVEAEADEIRSRHQRRIDEKVGELDEKRGVLEGQREDVERLQRERVELQQKIETPAGIRIRRFLDERIGSGDYQKRLGVPAIVRQDLERLSRYIGRENERIRHARGRTVANDYEVNRIVLYIDDLDRCPDHKVIEVLQAVHLLLAFELFIVVVAVDSRWLAHALRKEYPALAVQADGPNDPAEIDHPEPRDYLEKIFQVPFFVQPLGDGGRRNIVRGLLGEHLRSESTAPAGREQPFRPVVVSAAGARVLDAQVGVRRAPASLAIEAFGLTPSELEFVESLAPLLGDTPRAVKRFVNLFQLLRVILPDVPPGSSGVTDRQLAAFWLASANTDPDFAARLARTPPVTLGELAADAVTPPCGAAPPDVRSWIEEHPAWFGVAADDISRIGMVARRFSFGSAASG